MDHLTIGQVTFAEPRFLALLAVVPLAILIAVLGALARGRAARRFGVPGTPPRSAGRVLSSAVLILALALMAVAAARPQWGERPAKFRREGIDLAVAMDASLSMLTRDVEPSRLERSKSEVDRLFGSLRGDRVALVTFAGDATVRFPLTTDIEVARQLVRATSVDTSLRPGTNVAAAVNAARAAFLNDRSTAKVLLLITDGEQEFPAGTAATDAQVEIERAKSDNIKIIIAGVGTDQGGPIPIRSSATGEQTYKIDADTGRQVVSRLDDSFLRSLAQKAGGEYVRLDARTGLGAVSDRLAQLKASAFFEDTEQRAVDRFQWFVGGALVLLVLPAALGRLFSGYGAARRAALAGTLAAMLLLVACGEDEALRLNREGNDAYARGDYAGALQKYRQAQVKRPDLAELNYNAANALFRTNDMDRAVEEIQRALNSSDPALLARAYYSLGNFYATQDRWQEARAAYRNSLIQIPSDVDTKYNLEVANRKIALTAPSQQPPGAQASPTATPTAQPGATPTAQPGGTPGASPSASPNAGGDSGGGTGRPLPGATPPDNTNENPAAISREQERALRDALGKLDPGQPYDIEQALRILEALRKAQENRASTLPNVPIEGRRDW